VPAVAAFCDEIDVQPLIEPMASTNTASVAFRAKRPNWRYVASLLKAFVSVVDTLVSIACC
jgi:hypothetical protein